MERVSIKGPKLARLHDLLLSFGKAKFSNSIDKRMDTYSNAADPRECKNFLVIC